MFSTPLNAATPQSPSNKKMAPLLSLLATLLPVVHAPLALAQSPSPTPSKPINDPSPLFTGRGLITAHPFSSSSPYTLTPTLGCLNSHGLLTQSDCATFSINVTQSGHNQLFTSLGYCTFSDETAVQNTKSWYGKDDHALSCTEKTWDRWATGFKGELFYTIRGFDYPWICQGEFGCRYESSGVPTKKEDALPIWEYTWGSQQMDGTPGNSQVMLLWERTEE